MDSDEPQHLHIVWGWTRGLLPYRDFFDNHSPLFAWLCAPLFRLVGEQPNLVPWMRLAVLPAGVLCLLATYWLGARLFDRQTGLWAAAATGWWPLFFYTSSEFRPDILWTAFWLLALATLLAGRFTTRRAFFFGLLLGLAFATSLKTTLLAATLALAGGLVLVADGGQRGGLSLVQWGKRVAAAVLGAALVPGAFAAYFAWRGAWGPLVYCLVSHNVLPGLAQDQGWMRWRALLFPLGLPCLFLAARAFLRRPGHADDPPRVRRAFLGLVAGAYPLLLVSFWPLLTMQDYLPAAPPLALLAVAACCAAPRRAARPLAGWALTAPLCAVEIAAVFCLHSPWHDNTGRQRELLTTIIRLTAPDDPVMDDKGETIIRRRPFYYALENITTERMRRGLIADDIAARLVATGTAVVRTKYLPPAAQTFVDANYLPIGHRLPSGQVEPVELGRIAVLGKTLDAPPTGPNGHPAPCFFPLAIPARYVVLDASGRPAAGWLDGQPNSPVGHWEARGLHRFLPASPGRCTLFWADAWEKGFCPLTLSDSPATSHGPISSPDPGRPLTDPGSAPRR